MATRVTHTPPHNGIAGIRRTPPVTLWAVLGAFFVVLQAYLLIRWVSGPYFVPVPKGPSDPPAWMQSVLLAIQAVSIPAALFVLYRYVWRPWRRDRALGADAVMVLAFCTMWWQDPLPSYGEHWFVYNTWMLNYGSWAPYIPGWTSFGEPAAMTSQPILFSPATYVYFMLLGMLAGCAVIRRAHRRWPHLSTGPLVAICFVGMCLFDIVLEGLLFMPLGIFSIAGGQFALFPQHYFKYPMTQMLCIAAVTTVLTCLRLFVNDKGETLVERGSSRLQVPTRKKILVRVLAMVAAVNLTMMFLYNIPNAIMGLNSTPWPDDVQRRSYFTNGLCGEGTDRYCPGPAIPHIRNQSIYPNTMGTVTDPGGTALPRVVRFDHAQPHNR